MSSPNTYIKLLTTHARDPDLAINMGAISDHAFVKGQNLCTRSIPSPSSKTAPPMQEMLFKTRNNRMNKFLIIFVKYRY